MVRSIAPLRLTTSGGLVMNERDAANFIGLSVATLRAWRYRGKGPRYVKFGRAVRYLEEDLLDFINYCKVDNSAQLTPDASNEGTSEVG